MAADHPMIPAKNAEGDFGQFTQFMRRLVSVPRSEIQKRLEVERTSKTAASPVAAASRKRRKATS